MVLYAWVGNGGSDGEPKKRVKKTTTEAIGLLSFSTQKPLAV